MVLAIFLGVAWRASDDDHALFALMRQESWALMEQAAAPVGTDTESRAGPTRNNDYFAPLYDRLGASRIVRGDPGTDRWSLVVVGKDGLRAACVGNNTRYWFRSAVDRVVPETLDACALDDSRGWTRWRWAGY